MTYKQLPIIAIVAILATACTPKTTENDNAADANAKRLSDKYAQVTLTSDISNLSELGDPVTRTMVVEIMGRHSNIILRAADGRIVDAVRHVGQDISRVRQVLPGLTYAYPPAQGKLNPETATAEEIALRLAQEGDLAFHSETVEAPAAEPQQTEAPVERSP